MNTLSGILFFIAFLPYIWAIVSNPTAEGPSPVSWMIWASVDTLALIAMKKKGVPSTGQLTGAVLGAWIITILAIIFGRPTMGSIEWVSIVGALAGIILWKKYGEATIAIVCSQIAVFVGAFPTFEKGYRNPSGEDPVAWSIWLASCICALFAIKKWDVANALQPLTFTTIETVMVVLVVIRPHWL